MALEAELDDLIELAAIAGNPSAAANWRAARDLVARYRVQDAAALNALLEQRPTPLSRRDIETVTPLLPHGVWVQRERAIAHLPAVLRALFESGTCSLKDLTALASLDIVTLGDIALALGDSDVARGHRPATLRGPLAASLDSLRTRLPRIPIGRALDAAQQLLSRLQGPGISLSIPVGSLRRGQDRVGDIEVLVVAEQPEMAIAQLAEQSAEPIFKRPRRLFTLEGSTQVSVRAVDPQSGPLAQLQLTGSTRHLQLLREEAAAREVTLLPDRAVGRDGRPLRFENEEAIYHALGLPLIPPELREGTDELIRARQQRLPDLITRDDIAGDLHMHTHWSDGRDSVEDMVRAAVDLGYRYVAITDHSPGSSATRNLTLDGVARQGDEIAAVRERYPQITVLHGCEVDILPDGSLDFPERTLRRFDIVLASLHDHAGHSPQQLLRRYLAAMMNPNVSIITHPTNRVFPYREGYELDYDRLFEAAIETHTLLEIDGSPSHVDMEASLARRAIAAGVQVAIDSDSHSAATLGRHMQIGLMTARRAGVEAHHVVNARPWPEVRAMIARKRGRSLR